MWFIGKSEIYKVVRNLDSIIHNAHQRVDKVEEMLRKTTALQTDRDSIVWQRINYLNGRVSKARDGLVTRISMLENVVAEANRELASVRLALDLVTARLDAVMADDVDAPPSSKG